MLLFHRRTRSDYVYNACLAWYNVVLTPRIHSTVKYSQLGLTNNQQAHYTRGKIAVITNKEYNGILTYTPIDCIPRLNVCVWRRVCGGRVYMLFV